MRRVGVIPYGGAPDWSGGSGPETGPHADPFAWSAGINFARLYPDENVLWLEAD